MLDYARLNKYYDMVKKYYTIRCNNVDVYKIKIIESIISIRGEMCNDMIDNNKVAKLLFICLVCAYTLNMKLNVKSSLKYMHGAAFLDVDFIDMNKAIIMTNIVFAFEHMCDCNTLDHFDSLYNNNEFSLY